MSTTAQAARDPQAKPAAKIRKRAPKACLSCRARKVRCDVSQRGRPCMNCYLDSETCVVTGRASRFRRPQREGHDDAQISHPPYNNAPANPNHGRSAEDVVRSRDKGEPSPPQVNVPAQEAGPNRVENPQPQHQHQHHHHQHQPPPASNFQPPKRATTPPPKVSQRPTHMGGMGLSRCSSPVPSSKGPSQLNHNHVHSFLSNEFMGDQRLAANADVTFSYYRFLTVNNLHNVLPQDVNYLEAQGCMRVPTRSILDEFVQQYFLHVHPILPLINEGDFWDMYGHQGPGAPNDYLSLVVLQAMMFSSCNFVSKTNIKALGFPSIRAARAAFYRRAKLLYDFDAEGSLVELAQAALLLSYWAPNFKGGLKKPNSAWLGVSIQNAKSAEAHLQSSIPTFSRATHPAQYKRQNTLKRLWWCCIIRDRILPLGLRRSVQISRATFDLDANPSLGYADLADEVGRSRVYSPDTKRCLIEVLVQIVDLCIVLTDLLTLVFPLDDAPGWGKQGGDEAGRVRECKMALRRWYKDATLRFPMFGGGNEPRMVSRNGKASQHDSVILYTNLMYMYYHSARAALGHHEVLQLAVASATPNLNSNLREFSNIFENRHELQDAASGVTECLKELIQLDLARWLPISAVACTALPLVLHIIDFKLSTHNKGARPDPQLAAKQHRLSILIEAMKTYQPQYDGVDYVSETIRHIVTLAQLDPPTNRPASSLAVANQASISDWTDILASQPGCYLRLAMTMDLSLSKGRLPEESDFPASLRGLFTAGYSSVRTLLDQGIMPNHHQQAQVPPTPFTAAVSGIPPSYFAPVSSTGVGTGSGHGLAPNHGIAPGTVHSLSSDEDSSTSPASFDGMNGVGGGDNNQHPHQNLGPSNNVTQQQPQQPMPSLGGDFNMTDDVFAAALVDMDNLAGEVLAAYSLNADQTTPSSDGDGTGSGYDGESDFDGEGGTYIDTTGGAMDLDHHHDDWIGEAWGTDAAANHPEDVKTAIAESGGAGEREGSHANGSRVHEVTDGVAGERDVTGEAVGGERDTARVLMDALRDDGVSCGA